MTLDIRLFSSTDTSDWDLFCRKSFQGTILHTRKFLSYHQDKFTDQSLIFFSGTKWLGILPAAIDLSEPKQIISHPGATYGGILHQGGLRGDMMIEAFNLLRDFYSKKGFQSLLYKVTPTFYHHSPAQDDLYALFRLGACKIRCDLSSTIDLDRRLPLIKGRRWGIKNAQKSGVVVVEGGEHLQNLWKILGDNLASKYEAKPVHSLLEMTDLLERFPGEILCICAELNGQVVAGVILFVTRDVLHTQYIASNAAGREVSALDAVIEHCISLGIKIEKRWFDFGISNEKNGLILNDSLYKYKNSFGGGGFTHEFYKLAF